MSKNNIKIHRLKTTIEAFICKFPTVGQNIIQQDWDTSDVLFEI